MSKNTLSAEEHAAQMQNYREQGRKRALALGNRGPVIFTEDGKLHPDILAAYWREGFYVFEGLVEPNELADLRAGLESALDRAPVEPGAKLDRHGEPALGNEFKRLSFLFAKPLSDPLGGTSKNLGRHPVAMAAPEISDTGPKWTIELLIGNLQLMPACLRHYGHPHLLKIAEAINGPDFVPYNEVVFLKEPGLGPSVAWHQDGITHWEGLLANPGAHGFNFMTQLYASTAANAVWVLPGSHTHGKADIIAMVKASGSERLPDAVPMICEAGDTIIMNRQIVHGSYANTSNERRATVNAGFFPLKSVLNVTTEQLSGEQDTYTAERIFERCKIIALACDARKNRYNHEVGYVYKPLAQLHLAYNQDTHEQLLKNYNLLDMYI